MSPITDMSGDFQSRETYRDTDMLLPYAWVERALRNYLDGHDPKDPALSPRYADLSMVPPTALHVAEAEIVFDDAEDLARKLPQVDYHAWENVAFGYHHEPEFQRGMFMDNAAIKADTVAKMERFDVRPPDPKLAAKSFSGGNQQKIVLAREIERNPDLLLIGQPTRGVDIGAIEFIHQQIVALRDQGKAILLVSVELEEILALSDRIAVMFDGRMMGERLPDQTDEKELGMLMAGMTKEDAA